IGLNILSFLFFKPAKRLARGTKISLDDQLVLALQSPAHLWIILISSFMSITYLSPSLTILNYPITTFFKVTAILLAAYTINKIARGSLGWYSTESTSLPGAQFNEEVLPIISKTIAITIYSSAIIIILYQFGVEVAPLLAGLGIAGLAIALALQDSLTNFFSGVYVLADKPIRVGDYIKLEDGHEGNVVEIGWRSIKIRTILNNTIIIPNNKLAASVITNYTLPNPSISTMITVGVSYTSDPEKVEKVILNAVDNARKKTNKIVDQKEPIIRFTDFGEFYLLFNVLVPIDTYTSQWDVGTCIRKEIFKEFKKNKIEIPFPIRTVYMKKGK
ncbi:MAG: mechanosensitive ion channel family protein, partial [Candidatus Micrarchaeota archaeon]